MRSRTAWNRQRVEWQDLGEYPRLLGLPLATALPAVPVNAHLNLVLRSVVPGGSALILGRRSDSDPVELTLAASFGPAISRQLVGCSPNYRISMSSRFQRSLVGAVSLIVTTVFADAVGVVVDCTQ